MYGSLKKLFMYKVLKKIQMMKRWPLLSKDFNIWKEKKTKDSQGEAMAYEDQVQETIKMIRMDVSTARSLVTSLLPVQSCKRTSQRNEVIRMTGSETSSRRVSWQREMDLTKNMNQKKIRKKYI